MSPQLLYSPRATNPTATVSSGSVDEGKIPLLNNIGKLDQGFIPDTMAVVRQDLGTISQPKIVDWGFGNYVTMTLGSTVNLTLPPLEPNRVNRITLKITQDSVGARNISWQGGPFIWPSGAAPKLSTPPGVSDILEFIWDGSLFTLVNFVSDIEAPNSVLSRKTVCPMAPVWGSRYIVPVGSAGLWLSHDNALALWTGSSWVFTNPVKGTSVWLDDEKTSAVWDGTYWVTPQFAMQGFYDPVLSHPTLPPAIDSIGHFYKVIRSGQFQNTNFERLYPTQVPLATGNLENPWAAVDADLTQDYGSFGTVGSTSHATLTAVGPINTTSGVWGGFEKRKIDSQTHLIVNLQNYFVDPSSIYVRFPQVEYTLDGISWTAIALVNVGDGWNPQYRISELIPSNVDTSQIQVKISAVVANEPPRNAACIINVYDIYLSHRPLVSFKEGDYLFSNGIFWDVLPAGKNTLTSSDLSDLAKLDSNGKILESQLPDINWSEIQISDGTF